MENKFESALKATLNDECILSENGANMFATSASKLVDINFAVSSMRSMSAEQIQGKFQDAFYESPLLAVKWLFFARDIRGNGMGERRLFRICFAWLASARPELVKKLIPLVAEFGRFDDIICSGLEGEVWDAVVDYIAEHLKNDLDNLADGKPVSLLAKWMPSVNTSSPKTKALAKKLRIALGMDEKTYRKSLSALREKLRLVEVDASADNWSNIDYNAVPSMANIKYKNAFLKHDETRRKKYLADLEKPESSAKINASAAFPCDIVHSYSAKLGFYDHNISVDAALEAMWKALPDFVAGNNDGSTLVVCDGSGSMGCGIGGSSMRAIDVAHSLAIYFSEKLTGPFKDKYITFSSCPKYVDLSNAKTLAEKISVARHHSDMTNTDLKKTFMLILQTAVDNNLKQEDLPSNILLVSDMQWDAGVSGYQRYGASKCSLMKEIADEFAAHGYKLPRTVYWCVTGGCGRSNPIPVQMNAEGAVLVSGFSPALAKMVFSAKTNPYDVLVEALSNKRYQQIEDICKEVGI